MGQVSWFRQLGLALSLFILGTLAYWLEYKHRPEKETADEQSKKPFNLSGASIQSVTLVGSSSSESKKGLAGERQIVFKCADFSANLCKPGDQSKWEIAEPTPLRADPGNMGSLLSAVNNLTPTDVIDLKDESIEKRAALLRDYGLDPDSLKTDPRVEIISSAGKVTLYLGNTHPIGESIFALSDVKGKELDVYLIPSHFRSQFEHDLSYWRDKKLFKLGAYEMASFSIESQKAHLQAERESGRWMVHSGSEKLEGDVEAIDQFLGAAVAISAKSFVSDDQNSAKSKALMKGLKKVFTLSLKKEERKEESEKTNESKDSASEASEPIILTLFQEKKPNPDSKAPIPIYATVSDLKPFFEVDFGVKNRLDKELKDLRMSRLITPVDKFTAKHLEFTGTPIGEALSLVQKENKWTFATASEEVPQGKVQSFLDQLSLSKVKDFLNGASVPPGEKDGVQFTLSDEKDEAKRKYLFWVHDGKLYAKNLLLERKEALLMDSSLQKVIPWDKEFFKKGEEPKKETDPTKK